MIRRIEPGEGLLIITQPAHAWLAGQLAERWGNERFPFPEPREALTLAAHHHDDGWAEWEAAPRLRPDGRPPSFVEMHVDDHLAIWRRGIRAVGLLDPFAGLLVALHAEALYRKRLAARNDRAEVLHKIEGFLAEIGAAIERSVDGLSSHGRYGAHLPAGPAPETYAPLRLLQVWDYLSLLLCGGLSQARTIEAAPSTDGPVDLVLSPLSATDAACGEERFSVDPWPFDSEAFSLHIGARRVMRTTFESDTNFQAALAAAEWLPLTFTFEQS